MSATRIWNIAVKLLYRETLYLVLCAHLLNWLIALEMIVVVALSAQLANCFGNDCCRCTVHEKKTDSICVCVSVLVSRLFFCYNVYQTTQKTNRALIVTPCWSLRTAFRTAACKKLTRVIERWKLCKFLTSIIFTRVNMPLLPH